MPRHLTTGAAVGATNFGWYPPDNPYLKRWPPERFPYLRAQYSIMQRLVAGLRDAGVPLLVGTDPFVPCVIPGFSMKDELEQLFAAGLSPYQVLQTATSNAARFLGDSESGTIAKGKIADRENRGSGTSKRRFSGRRRKCLSAGRRYAAWPMVFRRRPADELD
jgi:hypothetical protein